MDQQNQATLEVGKKLVDLCKHGDYVKAVEALYSPDIESIEAMETPDMPGKVRGLEAIRKKNQQWQDTMEEHSSEINGPFPLGDRFAVRFKYDATDKKTQKRMQMDEVAIYTVRDGKIVKEEFFYTM